MQKKINKCLLGQIILSSIALLGFLAIMILVVCKYNFKIDQFNVTVANNRNNFLTGFFKGFTHLGSFYVLALLTLVGIALIWFVKKDKRLALFYGISFAKVCVANIILKHVIKRIRPEHLMIIKETGYSFPSGHAMMTFAFFFLLAHFLWITIKNKPLKITLVVVCAAMIEAISFSRIYLGVHYLTDIIAGWLITFAILGCTLMVYNSKMFRKKSKTNN